MNTAMRRFAVGRSLPSIFHPETAYCRQDKGSKPVEMFKLVTYTASRPEQMDQLPIAVVIRHTGICWPDLHHNRVGPLNPILKLIH